MPRVAELIYIEGDNKYNETIVSRSLPSSSVDYNWFTEIPENQL